MTLRKIADFVYHACQNEQNYFGTAFFAEHLLAEDSCVSNADAIAQITNAAYWLYYVYQIRQFEFDKGREWMRNRVEKNWHALIPQAKELIEEPYRGVTPRYESDRSEYL